MKTLRKGDELVRKDDKTAEDMVKSGWAYVPKSQWKKIHGKTKKVKVPKVEKAEPKVKGKKESQEAKSKYREKKAMQD